jgi:hypothetical protein
VIEEPPEFE